ncbi:MAG: hypothetical protein INH37_00455 [Myxococcaceae bacterium]|jgi:uncharacterized membrane protein (DUF441 family)|nr:hypothetical protein [Myxococcaceae bacterium]
MFQFALHAGVLVDLLASIGITSPRELASYAGNLVVCSVFGAALWRTLIWREGEE